MERVLSQEERIRRAEEIYAKRKNLRERTKRATVNVSEPKNFKLLKKLALQIIICTIIYYIFYLINTTSYSFSQETLSKTDELISHDFDFYSIYNQGIEWINNFLYSDENKIENQNEENKEEENILVEAGENTANVDDSEITQNEDESLTQEEVNVTEVSETERIKSKYSFTKPVER